ncbi:MAG: hydroxyacid dehydrogenase, partial [Alicyclobacillus sp.]|nr:hydroxyacid dehydrogenase [Alicyclobacillus sp.]
TSSYAGCLHRGLGGGPAMRIVISEHLWWPLPEWITNKYDVTYDPDLYSNPHRLGQLVLEASALVVRNRTKVDAALLNMAPQLRVIGRLGVGLDNIDLSACRDRHIAVVTARGCNANSVAEYVLAAMLEHARFLRHCSSRTQSGDWDRESCTGLELWGRTLALVGVGDIGQRVALRARAFGMHIVAYDPFLLPSAMVVQDFGVRPASLREVCEAADYLSIHVPLTHQTYHLIGMRELAWMKPTSVLINTSRGGILDEQALTEILQRQPERFAALDVREVEPPPPDDQLSRLPNVLLTPHIAGITHDSIRRVAEFVLTEVDEALQGRSPLGAVL